MKSQNQKSSEPQKVCGCCNKAASLTCSQCKSAQYCGQACQKKDWKYHKPSCLKIKEQKLKELKEINCEVCGKPSSKSCSRCKKANYCSIECQKANWNEHKVTC
jgi:hypothetical protein